MIVVPAIDLRGGRCVRLFRGDPTAETTYDADPVDVARGFAMDGARCLHVVDLDCALGTGSNRDIIGAICRNVTIPVQVGGGLRTIAAVEGALAAGASRAILGTAAALDAGFVAEAVAHFHDRVIVAIDVRGDRLMVRGWMDEGPRLEGAIAALSDAGAPRFLVTSIEKDGTMAGPDFALYRRFAVLSTRPVIASGGVRSAEDVQDLHELGLEAVVVGKALYSGALRLSEVVRE